MPSERPADMRAMIGAWRTRTRLPRPDDPYLRFVVAHGRGLLAAVAFALIVVRLYSGAFFDPAIAVYLIAHADTGRIVLSFAVLLAPFVAMALAVGAWLVGIVTRRLLPFAFAILLSLAATWITPVDYLMSLSILGGVWLIATAGKWRASGRDAALTQGIPWLGFIGFLYVFFGSLTALPWLPPEKVTLRGEAAELAYVVSESGDWVTLLSADRSIRVVERTSIVARTPCLRGHRTEERTLYQLLNGQFSALPDC